MNFREGMMCQKPESKYEEVKIEDVRDPSKKQAPLRDLKTKTGVENTSDQIDNKQTKLIHSGSNPMESNPISIDDEIMLQQTIFMEKIELQMKKQAELMNMKMKTGCLKK